MAGGISQLGTGFEARGISVVRRLDASDLEAEFAYLLRESNGMGGSATGPNVYLRNGTYETGTYETGTYLDGHKASQRSSSTTPANYSTTRIGRCKRTTKRCAGN